MRIISGEELIDAPETAQRLAESEPVFVVEDGKIEYVLMTIKEYRQRGGEVPAYNSAAPDETA